MSAGDIRDGGRLEASDITEGRWPTWTIGLALLGLVLVILGGAFFLNARLRPKVGIEPAATSTSAIPSIQGVSTNPALALPTVTAPTSAPMTASAASTGSSDAATVVSQAYLRYWDVYSQALFSLDASRLGDVMAGDELHQATQTVNGLRQQGHAAKTDVQHHFAIVSLQSNKASIQDEYVNRSYLIDAATKAPLGSPGTAITEDISCQMEFLDGTWKVVSVTKINQVIKQ